MTILGSFTRSDRSFIKGLGVATGEVGQVAGD
jgi:hypothetical protein